MGKVAKHKLGDEVEVWGWTYKGNQCFGKLAKIIQAPSETGIVGIDMGPLSPNDAVHVKQLRRPKPVKKEARRVWVPKNSIEKRFTEFTCEVVTRKPETGVVGAWVEFREVLPNEFTYTRPQLERAWREAGVDISAGKDHESAELFAKFCTFLVYPKEAP